MPTKMSHFSIKGKFWVIKIMYSSSNMTIVDTASEIYFKPYQTSTIELFCRDN